MSATLSTARTPTALEVFKPYVGANSLAKIKGRKAVLVVGRMGAGKSTAISVQLGATWREVVNDDKVGLELLECPVQIPKVSDGFMSTTLNVGVFPDPSGGRVFLDTAGLNENRGHDTKLWTTWSCSTVFSLLDEVSATLVVFDFGATLGGDRASGVRHLAECLYKLVGPGDSSKPFYDSMAFLVTNPFGQGGRRVQACQVTSMAEAVLAAEKNALEGLVARLSKVRPGAEKVIDWSRVSEEEKKDYQLRRCTVRLMEQLRHAEENGRMVLSYPDGREACQQQRQAVEDATARVQSESRIEKEALREIVAARETAGLEMCRILAELAGAYVEPMRKQGDALQALLTEFEKMEPKARAADANWEAVRDELLDACAERSRTCQVELRKDQRERNTLTTSMEMKPEVVKEIREAKCAGANPLSWFCSGYKWARARYDYEGEWFEDYVCTGHNFTKDEVKLLRNDGKGNGTVSLVFESGTGHDVRVDVKIRRFEKDLSVTRTRVAALDKRIRASKARLTALNGEKLSLMAVTSVQDLLDLIVTQKRKLVAENKAVEDALKVCVPGVPVGPSGPMREGHVLKALVKMLKLLKDASALSPDLDAGSRAAIDDLINRYAEVQRLKARMQEDPMIRKHVDLDLGDQYAASHDDLETMHAKRAGLAGRAADAAENLLQGAGRILGYLAGRAPVAQAVLNHVVLEDSAPIPVGLTVVVYALKGDLLLAGGAFLICAGVYGWLTTLAHRAERMTHELTARSVDTIVDAINANGERVANVGNNLAERIKVDLNVAPGDVNVSRVNMNGVSLFG